MAGVNAAVVLGDTIRTSHLPLVTNELMSEICLSSLPWASAAVNDLMSLFSMSTWACMSVQPTTRQGLSMLAFEKHTL